MTLYTGCIKTSFQTKAFLVVVFSFFSVLRASGKRQLLNR